MPPPLMLRCPLTPSQGASSLSLNSGTINLAFTTKKLLRDRHAVVFEHEGRMASFSLPYLFQTLDTTDVAPDHNVSVCDSELTKALKYTDISGRVGSHPSYPPFPLCRSSISSSPTHYSEMPVPNPASRPEGLLVFYDDNPNVDPSPPDPYGETGWVWYQDWTASITVPDTLAKTVSSGTL